MGLPPCSSDLPIVLYTNHPSWWDPLIGLVIKDQLFPDRSLFAPIDHAMLSRYRMFSKLGFFGVEQNSRPGAAQFLRTSENILKSPHSLLAITPQGRLGDARLRPVRFSAGLGHLAARIQSALFLPMAIELVFWEERLPEILVRFGEVVEVRPQPLAGARANYWTELFEQQLELVQDALSLESQRRDPDDFQQLLRGDAGQGGVYDWWRAFKAKLAAQPFSREHGSK